MNRDEILCRDFVELATEYLDGALAETDVELVEEHLEISSLCREYVGQIEATASAVGATETAEPPEETLRVLLGAFAARHGRAA
jgi:predicted anti-sigma-YlaC factor YlaD